MAPEAPTPEIVAYVAGLFDGEGCITVGRHIRRHRTSFSMLVRIAMSDLQGVELVASTFGGNIAGPYTRVLHHRAMYTWHCPHRLQYTFLQAILPYTRVKRAVVEAALAFWGDGVDYRRISVPPAVHLHRALWAEAIHNANHRKGGPVLWTSRLSMTTS